MTEDIRERFEKWHVDKFGYVPIWNRSRQQYAGRSREMAEIWQAALSSAGMSGTVEKCRDCVWHECVSSQCGCYCHKLPKDMATLYCANCKGCHSEGWPCGDSLSGKGEAINRWLPETKQLPERCAKREGSVETPKTLSGRLTEEIMHIFWGSSNPIKISDSDYNRVYSHVLSVLSAYLERRSSGQEGRDGK